MAMSDDLDYDRFHLDDVALAPEAISPPALPSTRVRTPAYAAGLRHDLNARALIYARSHGLLHDTTPGASPSVLFGATEAGVHGNFVSASYRAILGHPGWSARLLKVHTAHRRSRARSAWPWRELDTACSSDALLMNIFCYPGVLETPSTRALLGIAAGLTPEFGYRPRIPLAQGRFDRTEIDLRLGGLLVEAKLTESNFQTARLALIQRYRDLREVFDVPDEPMVPAYQLLRGALAAHAEPTVPAASFCVLADARRPDLLEAWYTVMGTVRLQDLRCRLQMLTWQELAATLPSALQEFLEEKYGIVPR